ncbi:MAG TPA: right-handed parallel beta-helix repeat-containing protein [Steroidobacteraceae bacterium]
MTNKPSALKRVPGRCAWAVLLFSLCAHAAGYARHAVGAPPRVAQAGSAASCSAEPPVPAVPRTAKIFTRGASADETAAIQQALNGLKSGDWLVFPSGTYVISRHLDVRASGVTLYGRGATLHSSNPKDGALVIEGDGVAVYGFTLEQDSSDREGAPWSGGISVDNDGKPVHGAIVQNNTIKNSAAAGILLFRADHFTVADNTVWRSWADGIHMTAGSSDGRVIHNSVSQNGDDMIAVVSYAGARKAAAASVRYADWSQLLKSQLDRNIYIYGNHLSDQYWGRGISVVGGSDVTIEDNTVSRTPLAAAIYLVRETSWMTFGDHNILVKNNTLSQIQTLAPTYKPPNITIVPTHMPAIEVGATLFDDEMGNAAYRSALDVSNIAIIGNTVQSARFAGIRIGDGSQGSVVAADPAGKPVTLKSAPGPVSNVIVLDNKLSAVAGKELVEAHPGLDPATISCSGNTFDGKPWSTCSSTIPGRPMPAATVTGASLQCAANGAVGR